MEKRERETHDPKGSHVPYFNIKPSFEVVIIITSLPRQFPLHDVKKEAIGKMITTAHSLSISVF